MSCSGTMGKIAIIPDNTPKGVINQALLKLTPTDRIIGMFLKLWMESTNFQQCLADFTYGAAIKKRRFGADTQGFTPTTPIPKNPTSYRRRN